MKRDILGKTVPASVLPRCIVQAVLKHALVPIVIMSLDAMQKTVKHIKILKIIYQIFLCPFFSKIRNHFIFMLETAKQTSQTLISTSKSDEVDDSKTKMGETFFTSTRYRDASYKCLFIFFA